MTVYLCMIRPEPLAKLIDKIAQQLKNDQTKIDLDMIGTSLSVWPIDNKFEENSIAGSPDFSQFSGVFDYKNVCFQQQILADHGQKLIERNVIPELMECIQE